MPQPCDAASGTNEGVRETPDPVHSSRDLLAILNPSTEKYAAERFLRFFFKLLPH